MSLHEQADGDNFLSRRQRRSSLLKLYAAKEGIQLHGGNESDLLKRLSSSLLQQNVAPSTSKNVPKRSASATKKTGIPTPVGGSAVRQRGRGGGPISAVTRGRGIPVSTSSSRSRPGPGNNYQERSSTKSSGLRIPTSRGRGGKSLGPSTGRASNNQNQIRRPVVPSGRDKTMGRSFGQPLKRSTSLDQNAWNSNSMMTPMTPGRSMMSTRSPMSLLRRYGSVNDISRDKGKTLVAPSTKDTKMLHGMALYVHNFLHDYRYTKVPATPQDMKQISANTYFDMVRFVAEFLVGSQFFSRNKDVKEDPCPKIVELTSILNYPGTITKSHLKSANAQHAWPTCITLLTWLCSRVRAALEMRNENSRIEFLKEDGANQIALPNYLEIYSSWVKLSEEQQEDAFQEKIHDQIQEFRQNVAETIMSEVHSSMEELVAQKNEKLAQLAELKAFPDPSKDAFEAVKNAKVRLEETHKRIRETKDRVATFRDVNSLKTKMESLKLEINSTEMEIQSIKKEVSSQALTREKAEKLVAETIDLKKQREVLHVILTKLESDLQKKKQLQLNLDQRFRQTIAKFTVVEAFNANLSNLKVDGLSVPANPLTAIELKGWLDKVDKIHEKTDKASQTLMEAVKNDLVKQKETEAKAEQALVVWWEKEAISKSKVKAARNNLTMQENQFKKDKEALITYLSELAQKREGKEKMSEEAQRALELKIETLQKLKIKKRNKEECSKAWNSKVCEWSDGLLYLENANALHIKKSVEEIVEHAREYVKKKNNSQEMELFESTAQSFLSNLSSHSLDTSALETDTSVEKPSAPTKIQNHSTVVGNHAP